MVRVTSCTVRQDRSCGCFETTFHNAHRYVTRLHSILFRRPDGDATRVRDESLRQRIFIIIGFDGLFLFLYSNLKGHYLQKPNLFFVLRMFLSLR